MINFKDPLYGEVHAQIKTYKDIKKYDLGQCLLLNKDNEADAQALLDALTSTDIFSGHVELSDWQNIVLKIYKSGPITIPGTIIKENKKNNFTPCELEGSAWLSYRETLIKKGFLIDGIKSIESISNEIVNQMILDSKTDVVKGLVVGNVQSGKTANMAGVISQAADEGWNLFVILSGTIENLRIQTQNRLLEDLHDCTNLSWQGIERVDLNPNWTQALKNLHFNEASKSRYLNVCLKNSKRMLDLIKWLNSDVKTKKQIRLVIIDDEADQASINAKSMPKNLTPEEKAAWDERTKINLLLTYLLTDKDADGNDTTHKFKSINYIAYTATPYANVLNEKPSPQSTYPSTFVVSLPNSPAYFGPQTIFGINGEIDPMPIVNLVDKDDVQQIVKIHKGSTRAVPPSLKESFLWFCCCFAERQFNKINKPTSMLVHTSQKQQDHDMIANSIKHLANTYSNNISKFLCDCKEVYEQQTKQFTLECFNSLLASYPYPVNDYVPFECLIPFLRKMITKNINSLYIDKDEKIIFNDGLTLCIDNCSHSSIQANGSENLEHIRLVYPSKDDNVNFPTAFIVVGGATLSRGLTIEGLTSTYFLRTVKQADTLMQMGRWFGYRKGYELYQRIWMTNSTEQQFEFLSLLDYKLRENLYNIEKIGTSPIQVGIKIMSHRLKSFLSITAGNKAKAATIVNASFNGEQYQTTMFRNDKNELVANLNNTKAFIESLGVEEQSNLHCKAYNSHSWFNVDNTKVIDYLKTLEYPASSLGGINYDKLSEWIVKNNKDPWHVVIVGVKDNDGHSLKITDSISINKVNRSKLIKTSTSDTLKIGVLRNPADLLYDIDESVISKLDIKKLSTNELMKIRTDNGLLNTPVLFLYFIDKNSTAKKDSTNRTDLNAVEDIVGTYVVVPEDLKLGNEQYIGIPVDYDQMENTDLGD